MRDWFFNLVVEIYEMHKANTDTKIQLISNITQSTDNDKKHGPNRSGILHGDQNHLDYGTKINAYKAFSFLAFIVFSAKDLLPKNGENVEKMKTEI